MLDFFNIYKENKFLKNDNWQKDQTIKRLLPKFNELLEENNKLKNEIKGLKKQNKLNTKKLNAIKTLKIK